MRLPVVTSLIRITLMLLLAVLIFAVSWIQSHFPPERTRRILGGMRGVKANTVGALLGMIPQGLVLLTSSVLAIATVRLARRKVLAQQLYCIETLARVDVLCLDKTGTITSGRMEVEGTYPLPVEGVSLGAGPDEAAVPVDTTVLDFALANVARATSADANETCQALLN